MTDAPKAAEAKLPSHVEGAVKAITEMHRAHHQDATRMERLTDSAVTIVGKPAFLLFVCIAGAGWIALGYSSPMFPDAFPFPLLSLSISFIAMFLAVLILASQRRADRLAVLRSQMTLEAVLLAEHKTAKIIQLMEELRRDLPDVRNRVDSEAVEMSDPPDHGTVMNAIEESTKPSAAKSAEDATNREP